MLATFCSLLTSLFLDILLVNKVGVENDYETIFVQIHKYVCCNPYEGSQHIYHNLINSNHIGAVPMWGLHIYILCML